jgi:hypothetical protein
MGTGVRRFLSLTAISGVAVLLACGRAEAAPDVQYGVQDDAWLLYGPGTVESRVQLLDRLGVDIVRFTIRWDLVAPRRPLNARNHKASAYDWELVDPVLRGLQRNGVQAVVTLLGTPRWANGGRPFNWAPTDGRSFADFAHASATRYPWVRKWTIWNEPNQARWLRPTSAEVYVRRLLNPAYEALHSAIPGVRVAGGVTAPRASAGGSSPVAWIRAMGTARAQLDAYAHHPYPLRPKSETPWQGGCAHCSTITMADLERLINEVGKNFGPKRIWLTEYGYQTNPPDRRLGVSPAAQARYLASAAHRAYLSPYVEMLIQFIIRDETSAAGWQSGIFTSGGILKPSYWAFRMPVTQARLRSGELDLWGQIRPGSGRQAFRLQRYDAGRWLSIGRIRWTDPRGFFAFTARAARGSLLRVWAARDGRSSLALNAA